MVEVGRSNDGIEPNPTVFLVGAGPGNPNLLTVRAVEVLARADMVLYDQLVPLRLLECANPNARKICIRDLPGNHPDKYPHIHQLLIESSRAGKVVVRLKGGDPLIFGRGGEEAEALRSAGVEYEIVPGVTAALAAGAFLDISLTHRNYSSAVAFVTGHELPRKSGTLLDWKALAAFPGTLCIYMGVARLPRLIEELVQHGKDPLTPAVIVERASTGDQRTVHANLSDLETARRNAGLESPGLIIIGPCVGHRPERSWWESRPLFGRRVLVTRPAHQAPEMTRKLELLGAVVYQLPTVEIREPLDFGPLDRSLVEIREGKWDWVVFTSANGVHGLMRRLESLGRDLRDFGSVHFAAIGPKTAEALKYYHLNSDIVPPETFSSDGLLQALEEKVAGQNVLLARANRGRDLLRHGLKLAKEVAQITVYDQVDIDLKHSKVIDALRRGEIHYLTLPSSRIAENLLGAFDEVIRARVSRGEIQLVAISPETGKAVEKMGYPIAAEARDFTTDGLITALIELIREQKKSATPRTI